MADIDSIQSVPAGPEDNSLRPSRKRRQEAPTGKKAKETSQREAPRTRPKAADTQAQNTLGRGREQPERVIPEEVKQKFVQLKNKYYFPDGVRAFTDRGSRLTTSSENTEVVRSLVQIAESRGWNEITVRGTERFRREAWKAAQKVGIGVKGYKPSEFERARYVRAQARNQSKGVQEPVPTEYGPRKSASNRPRVGEGQDTLLTGRLVDHGRATYHHDPRAAMSYFVTIETSRGDRTIWGVDFERAFKESLTKPEAGDEVGLRTVGSDAVKIRQHQRNESGQVVERNIETRRHRWIVEKREFFEARAEAAKTLRDLKVDAKQAVKQHPELVGTYLQVHAAELAAKSFRDPQDQKLFVERVRSALADSVARGEPLPAVRLRERAPAAPERSEKTRDRDQAPARG